LTTIHTLVPDVYELLQTKGWYNGDLTSYLTDNINQRLEAQWGSDTASKSSLRLSRMGDCCPKALWYSIHRPEEAEPLPSWAIFKYSYGHIIEALALTLAKAAGHRVEGEQDELVVDGIKGHRDAVIDGCVVDVKSATSFKVAESRRGSLEKSDSFGYLDQLDGYVLGSANDPLVTVKDKGYLWFIDKTLGHMNVYEHPARPERIRNRIERSKRIVECSSAPPCECGTRERGSSGNIELDVRASYSPYKHSCFPSLRTFLYADGPVYLSRVEETPKHHGIPITEVDRQGRIVYGR